MSVKLTFLSRALCLVQALYQKQGRSRQFGSKQERDAHIGDEIKQLERAAAVKRSSADDLRSHVQQLTSQLMDLSLVPARDCSGVLHFNPRCGLLRL